MTNIESSVLQRIIKLLRKAENTGELGNAAEAAAFTAKANEMLLRYKINRDELELTDEPEVNPISTGSGINPSTDTDAGSGSDRVGYRGRVRWFEDLAQTVAEYNFCRLLVHEDIKTVWVVGRKHDREIAEYLIKTLAETAWRLATRHYYQSRKEAKLRGEAMPFKPKQSFLQGFAIGIGQALHEQRRKAGSNPHALVVLKKSREEMNAHMKSLNKKTVDDIPEEAALDLKSLMVGVKAGQQAQVQGGIPEGTRNRGKLGA